MELNTTQQIVLVILSSALALFLILSVIIAIMIIRLVKTLKTVADKAEKVVESAEAVGEVFKKAARPASVLHFVQGLAGMVNDHKKKNK